MFAYLTDTGCWMEQTVERLCEFSGFRISSWPLRTAGYTTTSGTGTRSRIQPWIRVQCDSIDARWLSLCYVVGWRASFPNRAKEIRWKWKVSDLCLKAQVSAFPFFWSFGANGLIVSPFFWVYIYLAPGPHYKYELALPSTSPPKIRAIPGTSSIFRPSFTTSWSPI